jgi:plastocyanin
VRRFAIAAVAAALAALGGPAAWAAMDHQHGSAAPAAEVSIQFAAYVPSHLDVLTGEAVMWTNDSVRAHTVTGLDWSFDSGRVDSHGHYVRSFDAAGAYPYYCRLHPGIRGEVDAHELLLDPQPEPAAPGRSYPVAGRAALPPGTLVSVEGDSGSGYRQVGTAAVDANGHFSLQVAPATTTTYRAVHDDQASPPVGLIVLDHQVQARAVRHGRAVVFSVEVTPSSPGSTVVLQLRLRERFGWWPERRARLDGRSHARFVIHTRHRVRARVLLTRSDGATPLAQSAELRLDAGR